MMANFYYRQYVSSKNRDNTDVTDADHSENLKNLNRHVPTFIRSDETTVNGRAAVRCSTLITYP